MFVTATLLNHNKKKDEFFCPFSNIHPMTLKSSDELSISPLN